MVLCCMVSFELNIHQYWSTISVGSWASSVSAHSQVFSVQLLTLCLWWYLQTNLHFKTSWPWFIIDLPDPKEIVQTVNFVSSDFSRASARQLLAELQLEKDMESGVFEHGSTYFKHQGPSQRRSLKRMINELPESQRSPSSCTSEINDGLRSSSRLQILDVSQHDAHTIYMLNYLPSPRYGYVSD